MNTSLIKRNFKVFPILLLPILFLSFGSLLYAENEKLNLDYIAVNNVVVSNQEEIVVGKDDIVKIAGMAKPGDEISVLVGEEEHKTVADSAGNWFVLFSVANEKPLEVKVKDISESKEYKEKISFVMKENDNNVDVGETNNEVKGKNQYFLIPLFLILILLIFILIKKRDSKPSKRKD